MKRRIGTFALLLAGTLMLPAASPVGAQDEEVELRYHGRAVHLGTGPSGQAMIEITISRLSTEEEAARLVGVLENDGPEKLSDALNDEEETGFVRFPGSRTRYPSTRLHYARKFEQDGRTVIYAATNRPIGVWEAVRQPRSFDYDLTLIQLTLNDEGKGEGVLAVGVELGFDKEKNQLIIKSASSSPVRLTGIEQRQ